ncbi:hypothetical protein Tco_1439429 [Tanacetum coccineum]
MLSCGLVVSSGWSFVFAILGQMTYSMHVRHFTEQVYVSRCASFTIRDDSIYPLVALYVMKVSASCSGCGGDHYYGCYCFSYSDMALSVKVPVANAILFSSAQLLQENTDSVRSNQRMRSTAPSVRVPVGITITLAMAAVCASRAAVKSAISCRMASKVMAGVSDVDALLGGILST